MFSALVIVSCVTVNLCDSYEFFAVIHCNTEFVLCPESHKMDQFRNCSANYRSMSKDMNDWTH